MDLYSRLSTLLAVPPNDTPNVALQSGDKEGAADLPQPKQPRPEEFGLTEARLKYFQKVIGDITLPYIFLGILLALVCIMAVDLLLPASLHHSINLFWRILLPIIPAWYATAAIRSWRTSIAKKEPDYSAFTAFTAALQAYQKTLRTYYYLRRAQRNMQARKRAEQSRAQWRDIDGRDFEIEVVKILFSKGYDVSHTGATRSGDEGIDFLIKLGNRKIIGQCKAHKSYLSAGFVRELYGTLLHQKADEAWLVGTSGFYKGARSFAAGKPIRLLRIEELLRLPHASKLLGLNSEQIA